MLKCVKMLLCWHYISQLNTFIKKGRIRIRIRPLTNGSGSGVPKTDGSCGSGPESPTLLSVKWIGLLKVAPTNVSTVESQHRDWAPESTYLREAGGITHTIATHDTSFPNIPKEVSNPRSRDGMTSRNVRKPTCSNISWAEGAEENVLSSHQERRAETRALPLMPPACR